MEHSLPIRCPYNLSIIIWSNAGGEDYLEMASHRKEEPWPCRKQGDTFSNCCKLIITITCFFMHRHWQMAHCWWCAGGIWATLYKFDTAGWEEGFDGEEVICMGCQSCSKAYRSSTRATIHFISLRGRAILLTAGHFEVESLNRIARNTNISK